MIWLLVAIVIIALLLWRVVNSTKRRLTERVRQDIRAKWKHIQALVDEDNEHSWTKAIMEADKLLNYTLEQFHVQGNSIGERLKNSRNLFRHVDVAWRAHRVRNELAHDMDRRMNQGEARQVLGWFESALRQLEVL